MTKKWVRSTRSQTCKSNASHAQGWSSIDLKKIIRETKQRNLRKDLFQKNNSSLSPKQTRSNSTMRASASSENKRESCRLTALLTSPSQATKRMNFNQTVLRRQYSTESNRRIIKKESCTCRRCCLKRRGSESGDSLSLSCLATNLSWFMERCAEARHNCSPSHI